MGEKIVLKGFGQHGGKHCQTTALRSILHYYGIEVSEEMLFGLAGGIGFMYWYMKMMPAPFVGGRGGGKEFNEDMAGGLGIKATYFMTSSQKKAHKELVDMLKKGDPAYLFVDMAYLPYMVIPEDAHFGGHTVACYGIDEDAETVYLSDRGRNGVTVTMDYLRKARGSKFKPFPPQNMILKLKIPKKAKVQEKGLKKGIKTCIDGLLEPPIKNFGLAGMKKWAGLIPKWPKQFKGMNLFLTLFNVFIYIEIGGTGGSSFRPMYSRFLDEASKMLKNPALKEVAKIYDRSGKVWTEIAKLALPDSWPDLAKIRELSYKKNLIFEASKPDAVKKMLKLNDQMDVLMKRSIKDLQKKDTTKLFSDMKEKVLDLHDIEKEAITALKKAMK